MAIIVILAIIAIITVPIILNIIENSRKGAAIDSAYGYKDAISKYYVSEMIDKPDLKLIDGAYIVTKDGFLIKDVTEYKIATSGTAPSSGWVAIVENAVTEGCLTIGDYRVKLKDENVITEKGKCKFGGDKVEDEEKLPTGVKAIIYLDPTDLTNECDEGTAILNLNEDKTPTGIKTGCMKWYAIEELSDDDTYTMILDHNTKGSIEWVTEEDYNHSEEGSTSPSKVGIIYPGGIEPDYDYSSRMHAKGPITLLKQLQEDTESWSDTLIRSDKYNANVIDPQSQTVNYTIDYSGYKARLITAQEIADITGASKSSGEWLGWEEKTSATNFLFGRSSFSTNQSTTMTPGSNLFAWLYNNTASCENNGCEKEANNNGGYWTSSPAAVGHSNIWSVNMIGGLISSSGGGVRPVITVSKSLLSQE